MSREQRAAFAILTLALALFGLAGSAAAREVEIQQFKGVDSRVDYASLTRFGPWDDRNYKLTAEDLRLLSKDEASVRMAVPAFYRVEMRRAMAKNPESRGALYPHAAVLIFRQKYGGYLVDGRYYRKTRFDEKDAAYRVQLENGVDAEGFTSDDFITDDFESKFLSGEIKVTSPNGAAESAIKISPVNTNLVIAGSNGPGSGQKMHYSTNGGATWSAAAALPLGGTCCDPTIDWSSDGSFAYTATLGSCGASGCQIWFYRSADGGQTWNNLSSSRRTLSTGSANDKEFIHVDKYAGSPYLDNVYATWHSSNILQFARSTDFGNTWAAQSFSSATADRGIGSDITTDKNGNVYYFWPAFNSKTIILRKSTDGGATFGAQSTVATTQAAFAFPVPSMETREVFVYASADTDFSNGTYGNSIYVAWSDSTATTSTTAANNHARIQVAYSRNGGSTWTVTTPHETADANSVDRYHQWLGVGPDGTVHVIYYDSRRSASRQAVDVFYSYSTNGAQTWSTPARVTAQQSPNIADGFEFGDYNGLDIVGSDLIAIFTDNRNESGGSGDSIDVYAAGIVPGGGGGNIPPTANFTSSCTNLVCNFTDTSSDSDGTIASRSWNFGDGGTSTATNPSRTYAAAGTYNVTLTVTDNLGATGNVTKPVTVTSGGGGGGAQTAVFDTGLQAPRCSTVGISCTSASLVDGRATLGPETNTPNTIADSCIDGTSGTYHSDESLDRLVVSTVDGTNFAAGKTVRIDATVWAWTTPSADSLDLYYAANANSPSWVFIGTLQPSAGGAQTLSTTYTLPAGTLQAIRGNFRYQGSASSCSAGSYDDHDDLVFAVGGAANNPPTANFGFTCSGLSCNFTDTSTDSDGSVTGWAWNFGDGGTSTSQNPSRTFATSGTYNVALTVTDNLGATGNVTKPVTVTAPSGGPSD
ncbi:MAG: PKD domain-containing protein, partial [Thermoanaerobaculia bacterium]|nr:PKD domain-containing protein [Thermoanaerobaculia bacterium]